MNDIERLNEALTLLSGNDEEFKNELLENPLLFKKLLQAVAVDELKEDIRKQKLINSYDYSILKAHFLEMFSSEMTRKAYEDALKKLEAFLYPATLKASDKKSGKNVSMILSYKMLSVSPFQADLFLEEMKKKYSASSVIRDAGALSSFYSYFERLTQKKILNAFRGTRSRPKKKAVCEGRFFSSSVVTTERLFQVEEDIEKILQAVKESNRTFKACILIMAYRGLRAGSFENMKADYESFVTYSKGKKLEGSFPAFLTEKLIELCQGKKLDFSSVKTENIENLFKYYSRKLFQEGRISFSYSCHDLRHFFALNEYLKSRDIYNVSRLLFHSSISVTESYLKGLNVIL